jgi:putative glutamine amidotransferase
MNMIAVTSNDQNGTEVYRHILESMGATIKIVTPESQDLLNDTMSGITGLLLTDGPDIDINLWKDKSSDKKAESPNSGLDKLEIDVLVYALNKDLPVLALSRGMHILNLCQGGKLPSLVNGHESTNSDVDASEHSTHTIYLAPGAKASAVIGSAGFFRVNTHHRNGLYESQRAPNLMSTAYSVEDGLIEGLESPNHSWVIALQCNPERQTEVPRSFENLFLALVERATMYR